MMNGLVFQDSVQKVDGDESHNHMFLDVSSDEFPRALLLWSIWFGLIAGSIEVLIRVIQKIFLHEYVHVSHHVVWMAPLADTCLFAIVGIMMLTIRKLWPKLISPNVAIFTFSFLMYFGPLFAYQKLHKIAALLLSIGLAVQSVRVLQAHPLKFANFVRFTTPWVIGVIFMMALASFGLPILKERQAIANLPSPPPDAPNVLFIVLDTVRAKSLSLYGYQRDTTPNLRGLAKKGVVFDRAISTSPWTLPSHASMFTGRFPYELSSDWLVPLDSTYETLAEVFQKNGYLTTGIVGNLLYCTYEKGLKRGFLHYEDYPVSLGMILHSSWLARKIATEILTLMTNRPNLVQKPANQINKEFFDWLSSTNGRPFFAFLNYMDAHGPYLSPASFSERFGPTEPRSSLSSRQEWSPEEIQIDINAYDGALAFMDQQLGILLKELDSKGILKRTLVIITSDHGELFGEHNLFDHANSLYRPLLHVPFLISFPPHVPSGQRVDKPITLADLPATIIDMANLEGDQSFPGRSLSQYWNRKTITTTVSRPILSEVSKAINMFEWFPNMKGDMYSLVRDKYHYIRNGDGSEELYDIQRDSQEKHNLTELREGQHHSLRFRNTLEPVLSSVDHPAARGKRRNGGRDLPAVGSQ